MDFKNKQRISREVLKPSMPHNQKTSTKMYLLGSFLVMFVIPFYTQAGIMSKIADFFSSSAKADTVDQEHNSQTLPVLEAKMANTIEDTKTTTKTEALHIADDSVLEPEIGVLGSSLDVSDYPEEDEINLYITKSGDTLQAIAKMYGVSINTIIWANSGINNKTKLKEGTALLIMPVNGVSHTVKKGDTLAKIAKAYNADKDEIAKFNGITDETLTTGDVIIVPDGEMALEKKPAKKQTKNTITKIIKGNGKGTSKLISGYGGSSVGTYYRRPVRCVLTQGLHGKNGIDLGCPVGTTVVAAADGRVIAARSGWNGGYGNMVIISHPNGTQTLYGHLSRISVGEGDAVGDGDVIGATGNSGQSTGPHLHFEIRGAKNCFSDNSCR